MLRQVTVARRRVSQAGNSDYSIKTAKPAFVGQGVVVHREENMLFSADCFDIRSA